MYPYVPLGPKPKKNYRNPEGEVITEPNNFYTTRLKTGKTMRNCTFGGVIPYIADDYNVQKKMVRKELDYHNSKLQDKPFSQQAKRNPYGTFMHPKDQYKHIPAPPLKPAKSVAVLQADGKPLAPLHDYNFKPSGPGKKAVTIGKFPSFMADPPSRLKRAVKDEKEDDIPAFKPTTSHFTRPTPSVVTNFRNMKASFPMHFRK